MFESLSDKLEAVLKGLKGKGFLREEDIDTALKEVRVALLEADVNFKVVKDFIKHVREKNGNVPVIVITGDTNLDTP